jgi:hypothetical protein
VKLDHPVRKCLSHQRFSLHIAKEQGRDRKSGNAGARGHGALREKAVRPMRRVKFKQLYNGDDLRRLKAPYPMDFGASIRQEVAAATNNAKNTAV